MISNNKYKIYLYCHFFSKYFRAKIVSILVYAWNISRGMHTVKVKISYVHPMLQANYTCGWYTQMHLYGVHGTVLWILFFTRRALGQALSLIRAMMPHPVTCSQGIYCSFMLSWILLLLLLNKKGMSHEPPRKL